jgi:4'-phosphopantetheinyl transferase EntD
MRGQVHSVEDLWPVDSHVGNMTVFFIHDVGHASSFLARNGRVYPEQPDRRTLGLSIGFLITWRCQLIERILPSSVAVAEAFSRDSAETPRPSRHALSLSSVGWQAEWGDAFPCADAALQRLTVPAITPFGGMRAAPRLPEGMIGSIASCAGYRAIAVALTRDVVALGIDVQRNQPLPDEGLLDLVSYEEERQRLADLAASGPDICWDRLLFSAKLAVYKLWFPSAAWQLNLELADIMIDAHGKTFIASLVLPGPIVNERPITEMCGQWIAQDGFLATGVTIHQVPKLWEPAGVECPLNRVDTVLGIQFRDNSREVVAHRADG